MDQEFDDVFSRLSVTGSNTVVDMYDGNALERSTCLRHHAHTSLNNAVTQLLENGLPSIRLKGRLV